MLRMKGGVGTVRVMVGERLNRDGWVWGVRVRSDGGSAGSAQSDFVGCWVGVVFVMLSDSSKRDEGG